MVVEHARKHGQKVVVYSERLETVLYLEEGLARYQVERVASVVEVGESGVQLKSSKSIEQLIMHFAPISSAERGKRLPEDRYDVLLATDALSEGINLQDASFLVSYDLAWTADTIRERAGRASISSTRKTWNRCARHGRSPSPTGNRIAVVFAFETRPATMRR